MPSLTLREIISRFGRDAGAKLRNVAAEGEPEDQLRGPFEKLLVDISIVCGYSTGAVVAVGESSLSDLKTRPDYAVSVNNALAGFIEIKAPGKGADPRRYRGHDKRQWERLRSLPSLIYTDGNQFSLWHDGELAGPIITLVGDVERSGADLDAPDSLIRLFAAFLSWQPVVPGTPKQLAATTARLCRLLRDEVEEQLERENPALTGLATDWRRILFPEASNAQFADGYAQAVTFGLLMARARDIELSDGLEHAARELRQTNSLIGSALRLLTDEAESQAALKTSLGTLTRVLDAVRWRTISAGDADAWLYFYEDFLEIYDNKLRKLTGSYYTPPEVVETMVRLCDQALRSDAYSLRKGIASDRITLADPAVGTGTFLLEIFRQIARAVTQDEGEGAVQSALESAIERVIAFEIQLGPFAVAQLRIVGELAELSGAPPTNTLRMFVADTLSNPYEELEWIPAILGPIAESRRAANEVKKNVPITVVIGNPPYKEKAKGRGGWVEAGGANSPALLNDWIPPREWGVGAHAKHLRNLYVYFWRWATWKVFDHHPEADTGMVCFITVAGYLSGPGFERMREYLRRKCDQMWVIDCSPEGHQPDVSTRLFEAVQQPICIVLASKSPASRADVPATVLYHQLPEGHRSEKFEALAGISLEGDDWQVCPAEWRAPFLPAATGAWSDFVALDDMFLYNGSGVMPGRTWIIAPDAQSLKARWRALHRAPAEAQEQLFHPHLQRGRPGDRHLHRSFGTGLPGHEHRAVSVADDRADVVQPIRYGYRSFDRQWLIPDYRLINRPNPTLWQIHSGHQIYLTAPTATSPTSGPAFTFTASVPDLDHYKGRGGRVFPLWADAAAREANVGSAVLGLLRAWYGSEINAEDLFAYLAGVAAHSDYTARFAEDLVRPGLRIPLTASESAFRDAAVIGRQVIWLHTYGERFVDPSEGRPQGPPRLPASIAPQYPRAGAIPTSPERMPDTIDYDPQEQRLHIGDGYLDNVPPAVWDYEVSGQQVVRHWFSYRKRNRERPLIGDRRTPSALADIQPDHWPAEYTTDLVNLLHVLGGVVALEPLQATMLTQVCEGELIPAADLETSLADQPSPFARTRRPHADQHELL